MRLTKDLVGFYRANKDDTFLYLMGSVLSVGLMFSIFMSHAPWFLILPCAFLGIFIKMFVHDFRSWREFYGERQHDQNIQTG